MLKRHLSPQWSWGVFSSNSHLEPGLFRDWAVLPQSPTYLLVAAVISPSSVPKPHCNIPHFLPAPHASSAGKPAANSKILLGAVKVVEENWGTALLLSWSTASCVHSTSKMPCTWACFFFKKRPYNEKIEQLMNQFSVIALEVTSLVMTHFWILFRFMEMRDVNLSGRSLACIRSCFPVHQKALLFAVS